MDKCFVLGKSTFHVFFTLTIGSPALGLGPSAFIGAILGSRTVSLSWADATRLGKASLDCSAALSSARMTAQWLNPQRISESWTGDSFNPTLSALVCSLWFFMSPSTISLTQREANTCCLSAWHTPQQSSFLKRHKYRFQFLSPALFNLDFTGGPDHARCIYGHFGLFSISKDDSCGN